MKKLLFTILIIILLTACASTIEKPKDGPGTVKDRIPNGPLQGHAVPREKNYSWLGFLLCCGGYFLALMFIWALVYVGSRYDDELEEEWLERITSTPQNNLKNQQ